jgi:hypothetical protein
MTQENQAARAFIDHWSKAEASEMANSHSFIIGLTAVLGVPQPANTHPGIDPIGRVPSLSAHARPRRRFLARHIRYHAGSPQTIHTTD